MSRKGWRADLVEPRKVCADAVDCRRQAPAAGRAFFHAKIIGSKACFGPSLSFVESGDLIFEAPASTLSPTASILAHLADWMRGRWMKNAIGTFGKCFSELDIKSRRLMV